MSLLRDLWLRARIQASGKGCHIGMDFSLGRIQNHNLNEFCILTYDIFFCMTYNFQSGWFCIWQSSVFHPWAYVVDFFKPRGMWTHWENSHSFALKFTGRAFTLLINVSLDLVVMAHSYARNLKAVFMNLCWISLLSSSLLLVLVLSILAIKKTF